jgi:sensor histidine kinase regulating citrate/malate metabolism
MRLTFPRLRQLRLAAKLTVPFVVIFTSAIGLLGTVSIRSSRAALTQSLGKRAEILVSTLATTLADPFAMGEVDRLQLLLDEAKKTDSDVTYTILLNTEGKAVASTDNTLKNQTIMRNDFEKAMAQVTGLVQRPVPGADALFEVATPVRFDKNLVGVLRIGVSTRQVDSLLRHTTWTIVSVGALALLVGFSIYLYAACLITRPRYSSPGDQAAPPGLGPEGPQRLGTGASLWTGSGGDCGLSTACHQHHCRDGRGWPGAIGGHRTG